MDQTFARLQPIALSLFRFITGLLLFQYGVAKLLKFPAGNPFEKVELFSLIGAAGVLELVLGGLLIIGLFSRIVAFILSGQMAFAFHRALSAQLLSALQQRHRGDPILLCLPLSGDVRRRPVQR